MELSIVLVYAIILGLVAPYLSARSGEYGLLLPPAIATVTGSIAWIALTWTGFKYDNIWTWIIIMLAMPTVMVIASSRLAAARIHAREAAK
jgi:hypothetical protein